MLPFQAILKTCNIKPFSASGGTPPRSPLLELPTTSTTGSGITILLVMPLCLGAESVANEKDFIVEKDFIEIFILGNDF